MSLAIATRSTRAILERRQGKLLSCPPQIIAHSVGTWVAFELLAAARGAGLPMPRAAFLSAMAAPDMPEARRPWRRQQELSEAEFQVTLGSSCCTPVASCTLFLC